MALFNAIKVEMFLFTTEQSVVMATAPSKKVCE